MNRCEDCGAKTKGELCPACVKGRAKAEALEMKQRRADDDHVGICSDPHHICNALKRRK